MKKSLLYLTLTATLGLAGAGIIYESTKTEIKPEIKQKQTLEQITFEQAKLNHSLRQQYLDQVLENKDKIGEGTWYSFERLIYDPNFEKLEEYSRSVGNSEKSTIEKTGITKVSETGYAGTILITKEKGKKYPSFYHERCFSNLTEEELLSCIDKESSIAYMSASRKLPGYLYERGFKYKFTGKESTETFDLCIEAIGYDMQVQIIIAGRRKINKWFEQGIIKAYYKIYEKLKEISEQNKEDSDLAKEVIKALGYTPKKK